MVSILAFQAKRMGSNPIYRSKSIINRQGVAMTEPISPKDILDILNDAISDDAIEAINELLVEKVVAGHDIYATTGTTCVTIYPADIACKMAANGVKIDDIYTESGGHSFDGFTFLFKNKGWRVDGPFADGYYIFWSKPL